MVTTRDVRNRKPAYLGGHILFGTLRWDTQGSPPLQDSHDTRVTRVDYGARGVGTVPPLTPLPVTTSTPLPVLDRKEGETPGPRTPNGLYWFLFCLEAGRD